MTPQDSPSVESLLLGLFAKMESSSAIEAMNVTKPYFRDSVTGLWKGDFRVKLMLEMLNWVEENPEFLAFYAEVDIRCMGGANARLGHQRTNELVLRPLAGMFQTACRNFAASYGGKSFEFRHGGDEMSAAILVHTADIKEAEQVLMHDFDDLCCQVFGYAYDQGLRLIPNPKGLKWLLPRHWGVGLAYGFSPLRKLEGETAEVAVKRVFSEADQRVERQKCSCSLGEESFPPPLSFEERLKSLRILVEFILAYLRS